MAKKHRSERDSTELTANGELVTVTFERGSSRSFPASDKMGIALAMVAKDHGLTTYRAYDQDADKVTKGMLSKSFSSQGITSVNIERHDKLPVFLAVLRQGKQQALRLRDGL